MSKSLISASSKCRKERRQDVTARLQNVTVCCQDVTVRCQNVTVCCQDVTVHCQYITVHCQDVTVRCQDVTVRCQDVTVRCANVTVRCQDVTERRKNVIECRQNVTVRNQNVTELHSASSKRPRAWLKAFLKCRVDFHLKAFAIYRSSTAAWSRTIVTFVSTNGSPESEKPLSFSSHKQ